MPTHKCRLLGPRKAGRVSSFSVSTWLACQFSYRCHVEIKKEYSLTEVCWIIFGFGFGFIWREHYFNPIGPAWLYLKPPNWCMFLTDNGPWKVFTRRYENSGSPWRGENRAKNIYENISRWRKSRALQPYHLHRPSNFPPHFSHFFSFQTPLPLPSDNQSQRPTLFRSRRLCLPFRGPAYSAYRCIKYALHTSPHTMT